MIDPIDELANKLNTLLAESCSRDFLDANPEARMKALADQNSARVGYIAIALRGVAISAARRTFIAVRKPPTASL